jgi:F0F1-type ATP synthase assembly protein I
LSFVLHFSARWAMILDLLIGLAIGFTFLLSSHYKASRQSGSRQAL